MTEKATQIDSTLQILESIIDNLGAPIGAAWGVDEKGHCRCPLKASCGAAGKHPDPRFCPQGVKSATLDKSVLRDWVRRAPHGNWFKALGHPVPRSGGRFLGDVDVDLRNGGFESLDELAKIGRVIPETIKAISGGAGFHASLTFEKPPASRTIAPGIDFQGFGKYTIIPPSLHRLGKVYYYEIGCSPEDLPPAAAPAWMENETGQALPRPERADGSSARETVLGEAFALAGRIGPVAPDGSMYVKCVQSEKHSDSRGQGSDSSTVILPPAGGSRFGGYRCFHSACVNLKWNDVLKLLPKEAVDAANLKYPRLGVAVAVPPAPPPPEYHETPSVGAEIPRDHPSLRDVQMRVAFKDSGVPKGELINVVTVLTYDPRWKGILRWDEFSQVLKLTAVPPWHKDDKPKQQGDSWSDEDTTRLDAWLRRYWNMEAKTQVIRDSVYLVGRRDSFHPLQDWLNGLVWDGESRLDRWLVTYLGATDTPYHRSVGRKWMISAVARVMSPGAKVDTLLVLEGPQGKGKSTALKILAGGDTYFTDTPIDIGGGKDAFQALRGRWIIELAELAGMSKAEVDKAKAFFSSSTDSFRPPYGRETIQQPRQNVFCGTVNFGTYLSDPSGGRRFWPALVGVIDLESLTRDREQLWAEAVRLYKEWVARGSLLSECLWWPSLDEVAAFTEQQEQRDVGDIWDETIRSFLESEIAQKIIAGHGCITTAQIGESCLGLDIGKMGRGEQMRIGAILSRMKWKRVRPTSNGQRIWGYVP